MRSAEDAVRGSTLEWTVLRPSNLSQDFDEDVFEQGVAEAEAEHVTAMFELMARGVIAGTTDGVATVLGREPRAFEEYVVRAAAAGAWDR
jgi:uncharacterized protein YbjT (DUF2867 family)